MKTHQILARGSAAAIFFSVSLAGNSFAADPFVESALERIGSVRGVICLAGIPEGRPELVVEFAKGSEFTFFVQAADRKTADALRRLAEKEGLLGGRVFVAEGRGQVQSLI